MSERVTGWNSQDGMDFIDMYCMCYDASLCITSSFYSSFATPSEKKRLQWEAKVSSLAARTRQTLSSLISLQKVFNTEGVTLA
jgi:hypothetical protein